MKSRIEAVITGLIVVALVAALAYYSDPAVKGNLSSRLVKLVGGSERDNRLLGELDLVRLYPSLVLRQGPSEHKVAALTFDDGPDRLYTPQVLDVLASKGVTATFFLIGNRVDEYPEVARRIISEGHLIGNHSYSHPVIQKASGTNGLQSQLCAAEEAFARAGVTGSGLFRPPYGAISPNLVEQAASLGYRVALWSIDSLDWRGLDRDTVVGKVMEMVAPGAVILQHSSGGPGEDLSGSVQALPIIIDTLRERGYTFTTMDKLFPPAEAKASHAEVLDPGGPGGREEAFDGVAYP